MTSIVAASLILENVIAIELTKAICEQFESDNLERLQDWCQVTFRRQPFS